MLDQLCDLFAIRSSEQVVGQALFERFGLAVLLLLDLIAADRRVGTERTAATAIDAPCQQVTACSCLRLSYEC